MVVESLLDVNDPILTACMVEEVVVVALGGVEVAAVVGLVQEEVEDLDREVADLELEEEGEVE